MYNFEDMKGILSYKNINGAVKDVDMKNRVVTGYLSTFDEVDSHEDVMVKGAFSKTLKERRDDIFFLNQHNFAQPHGKFAVLQEDGKGLYFESEPLVKGVSYSDDALKLYDAGVLTEHSIGFVTINAEDKSDARHIKEVKLYEGSNVTIGANRNAKFSGLKSLNIKQVNDQASKILKYLRNGNVTDDTFKLLEIALKDLQAQAYHLGITQKDINRPFKKTPSEEILPYINTIKNYKIT